MGCPAASARVEGDPARVGRRSFLVAFLAMAASPGRAASEAKRLEPGDPLLPLEYHAASGARGLLPDLMGKQGLVLVTWDKECPVSQRYQPRIRELAAAYTSSGFVFAIVDVTPHGSEGAADSALEFPGLQVLLDSGQKLAMQLAAESTAESYVFGRLGRLEYRGAIDDQYGFDFQRGSATRRWLATAIEASLRGARPGMQRTRARGCPLGGFCAPPAPRTRP